MHWQLVLAALTVGVVILDAVAVGTGCTDGWRSDTVLAPKGGDLNFKECCILGLCSDACASIHFVAKLRTRDD